MTVPPRYFATCLAILHLRFSQKLLLQSFNTGVKTDLFFSRISVAGNKVVTRTEPASYVQDSFKFGVLKFERLSAVNHAIFVDFISI